MWRALACGALVAVAGVALAVEVPRADDPDHFTPADKAAMLQFARRRLAAKDDLAFDPATMPAKLLRSTGQPLVLSAHSPGEDTVVSAAVRGTLLEQLNHAARKMQDPEAPLRLAAIRLKLDLVTSVEPFAISDAARPVVGIEGLRLRWRNRKEDVFLPPSEALRQDLADGEAFVRKVLGWLAEPGQGLGDLALARFSTESFIERQPGGGGGPPVDLYRGMPLVDVAASAVLAGRNRDGCGYLLAAAEAAGDYLLRFQKPDGSFNYLYDAAKDAMSDEGYEITRHAGTACSLAQLYGATGRRRFRDGARGAIEWLLGRLRTRDELAWVEHEGEGQLGSSALAAFALLEYRAARGTRRYDREIRKLGRFLAFMQRPDGFFHSHYDAKEHRGFIPDGHVPLFAPGEAFLALVRLQRALPDPIWQRAAAKAADFLTQKRDAWHYEHDLRMVHPDSWTMMALDDFHAQGSATRAQADYCFFLAHEILKEQEEPATARWRDHVGAPRTSVEAPNSAVAAGRCEGLLAAWRLARRMGVAADDYRRAILLSVCFQLAHQYGPVNSYLLPDPARALGGFYASYADHTIRMDYVQHNISSLLGAAQMLGGEGAE